MIRSLLPLLMALHGLIHLIGVSKTAAQKQVPKSVLFRSAWLISALLFLILAYLVFARPYWWHIALCALVVSQVLIVKWWKIAKWGTIVNVVVCLASVVNFATWQFKHKARSDAQEMLEHANIQSRLVSMADVKRVPPVVQKWLIRCGVIGRPYVKTMMLKQKGRLRTKPGAAWMAMTAEQYFTVEAPAFLWCADIDAGLFHMAGMDRYINTHGHMEIKAAYIIPVANSSGAKTDQGTRLRYLAEIQWFPSAALLPQIRWTQTGPLTADAEMSCDDASVKGTFTFNEAGDIVAFEADRYMDQNGTFSLQRWYVPVTEYLTFDGIRIPSKGKAIWRLSSGDFNWFNWEITEVNYNERHAYSAVY